MASTSRSLALSTAFARIFSSHSVIASGLTACVCFSSFLQGKLHEALSLRDRATITSACTALEADASSASDSAAVVALADAKRVVAKLDLVASLYADAMKMPREHVLVDLVAAADALDLDTPEVATAKNLKRALIDLRVAVETLEAVSLNTPGAALASTQERVDAIGFAEAALAAAAAAGVPASAPAYTRLQATMQKHQGSSSALTALTAALNGNPSMAFDATSAALVSALTLALDAGLTTHPLSVKAAAVVRTTAQLRRRAQDAVATAHAVTSSGAGMAPVHVAEAEAALLAGEEFDAAHNNAFAVCTAAEFRALRSLLDAVAVEYKLLAATQAELATGGWVFDPSPATGAAVEAGGSIRGDYDAYPPAAAIRITELQRCATALASQTSLLLADARDYLCFAEAVRRLRGKATLAIGTSDRDLWASVGRVLDDLALTMGTDDKGVQRAAAAPALARLQASLAATAGRTNALLGAVVAAANAAARRGSTRGGPPSVFALPGLGAGANAGEETKSGDARTQKRPVSRVMLGGRALHDIPLPAVPAPQTPVDDDADAAGLPPVPPPAPDAEADAKAEELAAKARAAAAAAAEGEGEEVDVDAEMVASQRLARLHTYLSLNAEVRSLRAELEYQQLVQAHISRMHVAFDKYDIALLDESVALAQAPPLNMRAKFSPQLRAAARRRDDMVECRRRLVAALEQPDDQTLADAIIYAQTLRYPHEELSRARALLETVSIINEEAAAAWEARSDAAMARVLTKASAARVNTPAVQQIQQHVFARSNAGAGAGAGGAGMGGEGSVPPHMARSGSVVGSAVVGGGMDALLARRQAALDSLDLEAVGRVDIEIRRLHVRTNAESIAFDGCEELLPPATWANKKFLCWDRVELAQTMLVYSVNQVHAALTTLQRTTMADEKERAKVAAELAELVLLYGHDGLDPEMTDEPPLPGIEGVRAVSAGAHRVLTFMRNKAYLANELYALLVKQLTGVPVGLVRERYWKLMGISLCFFAPMGEPMQMALHEFLLRREANKHEAVLMERLFPKAYTNTGVLGIPGRSSYIAPGSVSGPLNNGANTMVVPPDVTVKEVEDVTAMFTSPPITSDERRANAKKEVRRLRCFYLS